MVKLNTQNTDIYVTPKQKRMPLQENDMVIIGKYILSLQLYHELFVKV